MDTLTTTIAERLHQVVTLLASETDGARRDELLVAQAELSAQMQALIDAEIPKASDVYRAASEGLDHAGRVLEAAIEERDGAGEAIGGLAEAIERIDRLIETLSQA
ncbi:MAG: hypothetical protein Tsb0013_10520 [Phycisphaerales bacterium]